MKIRMIIKKQLNLNLNKTDQIIILKSKILALIIVMIITMKMIKFNLARSQKKSNLAILKIRLRKFKTIWRAAKKDYYSSNKEFC